MACQITELRLNGYNSDGLGRPRELYAYARVDGFCPSIEFSVCVAPNGLELYRAAAPVENGVASVGFSPEDAYPCDARLWVSATCMPGAECTRSAWLNIACKAGAVPAGGGAPGEEPGGGEETAGTGDWPWPAPPHIFCPMVGRAFTEAFAGALLILVAGLGFGSAAGVATGVGLISIAFTALAFWRHWCVPPECYVVGAMLWGLKRAVAVAVLLAVGMLSVTAGVGAIALGAWAGICTAYLRKRRCSLPKMTAPLSSLPVW